MLPRSMTHFANLSRKDVLKGLAAALLIGLGGAGQQAPARRIVRSRAENDALDKIAAYLNGVRALKGGFVQIGPQGQMDQGTFYLLRPGKVRFEYNPPSPVLVVSDGRTVAVANRRLGTVDRYPIGQTPFRFFLSDTVDLVHSDAVLGVDLQPGTATVRARTDKVRFKSDIAFVFAWPVPELRQWTVADAQGQNTTVSLTGLQTLAGLDPALFVLPKPSKPAPHKI